jgi:adenylate kinase family enzyme
MKGLEFPIVGTKTSGVTNRFDLASPMGRKKYFNAKVGDEIGHLNKYLENGSFIAYFLGKKNSGKGTYSKLFTEIFGEDKVAHVSVGDLVRDLTKKDYKDIEKFYRGYVSFDEAIKRFEGRSTEGLLPTEFILALLKHRISELEGKSIFIDGLPRDMDQISYSLYFRDLINYRDDPDLFILIDIPESVIAARIKTRVVCPKCGLSRNPKLLLSSKIDYDKKTKMIYLLCDNPECQGAERLMPKEGDELGIEPQRARLVKDEEVIRKVFELHGVPKILIRNHVPVKDALKYFDTYEITPEYILKWDDKKKKIEVEEKPWQVKDDNGVASNSLLAPPVVVGLIKQLAEVL